MGDRLAGLETRLAMAARRHWSYRLERLAGPVPLWRMAVPARGRELARVGLAAGWHGGEPAGVEATLRFLEAGALPPGISLEAYPCVDVDGFDRGTRGDAAPSAAMLARAVAGRRLALYVDLIDDDRVPTGYVLQADAERLVPEILAAWAAAGLAVAAAAPPHRGGPADGMAAWVAGRHAAQALTLGVPARAAWETRVAAHLAGLRAACAAFSVAGRFAPLAGPGRVVPFSSRHQRGWDGR